MAEIIGRVGWRNYVAPVSLSSIIANGLVLNLDAGNAGSPYCNEIDFLETNGNRIFQQTIHLNNTQRYEYSR